MKIYTINSESHQPLFDIFKNSLSKFSGYELINRVTKQVSKTGDYGTDDIINFWYLKTLYILEALYAETEPFLYADTDIYVFRDFKDDLKKQLGDNDIAIQFEKDAFGLLKMVCAGFIYIRPNKRTKRMFLWILKNLQRYGDDQRALNHYIWTHNVKVSILPKTYYSINYDNGNKVWDGEDVGITVKNPFLVHLHWTIGMENRLNLLDMVRSHREA